MAITALSRRNLLAVGPAALAVTLWPARARAFPVTPDWHTTPLWLMMVTSPACYYCAAWKAQIGPDYSTSTAGRVAPIFEIDLDGPYPDGLALDRKPQITPSFILLHNGAELGRIEGYVGKNHFHPVLQGLLTEMGQTTGVGG